MNNFIVECEAMNALVSVYFSVLVSDSVSVSLLSSQQTIHITVKSLDHDIARGNNAGHVSITEPEQCQLIRNMFRCLVGIDTQFIDLIPSHNENKTVSSNDVDNAPVWFQNLHDLPRHSVLARHQKDQHDPFVRYRPTRLGEGGVYGRLKTRREVLKRSVSARKHNAGVFGVRKS